MKRKNYKRLLKPMIARGKANRIWLYEAAPKFCKALVLGEIDFYAGFNWITPRFRSKPRGRYEKERRRQIREAA